MHVDFAKYLVVAEGHDSQGYDEVAGRDQEGVRTSFKISRNLRTTLTRTLQIKRKTTVEPSFFISIKPNYPYTINDNKTSAQWWSRRYFKTFLGGGVS